MKISRMSIFAALQVILWTSCGALTLATLFFISFFPEYSPFASMDIGFNIIFAPIAVSFMVGLLANEQSVPVMILLSLTLVFISVIIAFLAVYSPLVSGIVGDAAYLPSTDEQRMSMVFTTLFIIPLTIIGTVLGKAVGGVVLPSEEELLERRMLREQTLEWHERLTTRDEEPETEPSAEEE